MNLDQIEAAAFIACDTQTRDLVALIRKQEEAINEAQRIRAIQASTIDEVTESGERLRYTIAGMQGRMDSLLVEKTEALQHISDFGQAQDAAPAAAVVTASEPFMYAIMTPEGKPYFDEHCVDDDPKNLYSGVNHLNDSPDTGYKIVALYAVEAPPVSTLIEKARAALAEYVNNSQEHDVGGGDVVVATCESREMAQEALSAIDGMRPSTAQGDALSQQAIEMMPGLLLTQIVEAKPTGHHSAQIVMKSADEAKAFCDSVNRALNKQEPTA